MEAADAHELLSRARSTIERLHRDGCTKHECALAVNAVFPGYTPETIDLALKETQLVFSQAKVAPQFSDEVLRAAVYFVVGRINDFQVTQHEIVELVPLRMLTEIAEHVEYQPFPSIGTDIALRFVAGTISALESGNEVSLSHQAYEGERSKIWALEGWSGGADPYWPPTKQTIMKRLGNSYWDDAMVSLGLIPSARRGRPRGTLKYSTADYEAAVRDYLGYCQAHSTNPTVEGFEQWVQLEKAAGRQRPSSMSVRNVFGGWISAVQSGGKPGSLSKFEMPTLEEEVV